MNEYLVLIEGEKGLFASDGRKPYFPHRTFSSATVGIVSKVAVEYDKGNYAFISGSMVETLPIEQDDILSFVNERNLQSYVTQINHGVLRDSNVQLCVIYCEDELKTTYILFKTSKGLQILTELNSDSEKFLRYNYNNVVSHLRDADTGRIIGGTNLSDMVLTIRLRGAENITTEQAFILCVNNYWQFGDNDAEVYDDRYVKTHDKLYYFINGELRSISAYSCIAKAVIDLSTFKYKITEKEVTDYMVENNIGYGSGFDGHILERHISVFNEDICVKLFNSRHFKMEFLKEESAVNTVQESVKELESFRKKIGKQCSKSMISELQKLSLRNICLNK